MPETATLIYATQELMPSMFGSMRLRVDRDSVDMSRLTAASGLSLLAGHDSETPLGRVTRAELHDGVGYMSVRLESTTRAEPYLEELRAGTRIGISPGFIILESQFIEEDNEVIMEITRFQPYEVSATSIPKMMSAAIIKIDGSPSTSPTASHEGAPSSGVDLSAGEGKRSKAQSVLNAAPDARTAEQFLSHNSGSHTPGRARVTEPTPTAVEREKRMSEIETRVDEKLVDLSRRERMLADVESLPATGDPQPLAETLLALCSLATNPSGPTPRMPGVVVQTATRNHVSARVPTKTLALVGATTYGSEIESPTEPGDIQPTGRRASRLLGLMRQVSVTYGSKSLPTLDSPPASGMIADGGAPLAVTDATFKNPAPRADFHQGQTRASYSLQSLIQGGETFKALGRRLAPCGYGVAHGGSDSRRDRRRSQRARNREHAGHRNVGLPCFQQGNGVQRQISGRRARSRRIWP